MLRPLLTAALLPALVAAPCPAQGPVSPAWKRAHTERTSRAKDAASAKDLARFPDLETAREMERIAKANCDRLELPYKAAVAAHGRGHPGVEALSRQWGRANRRESAWRMLRMAHEDPDDKPGWLVHLIEQIGVDAYRAGRMPPAVVPEDLPPQ